LEALALRLLANKGEVLDVLAAEESTDADETTVNHSEHEGIVSVGAPRPPIPGPAANAPAEEPASDEQLLLWVAILREEGGHVGLVDGEPTVTWPEGKDTPGRRRDWQWHGPQLARLLADEARLKTVADPASAAGGRRAVGCIASGDELDCEVLLARAEPVEFTAG
jgi:hypothetical protein